MSEMTCTNHPEAEGSIVRCSRCLRPFCADCLVRLSGRPFCGDCKLEQVRDVQSGVTPGSLQLASIGIRFVALFIDGFIIGLPTLIIFFFTTFKTILAGSKIAQMPFGYTVLQILVMIIYEGLMLSARGQTLGKMAVNIKVVRPDGTSISSGQAWGRAAVRAIARASTIPLLASLLSIINYLPAFFTKEKTPIHEMVAKTRVVLVA